MKTCSLSCIGEPLIQELIRPPVRCAWHQIYVVSGVDLRVRQVCGGSGRLGRSGQNGIPTSDYGVASVASWVRNVASCWWPFAGGRLSACCWRGREDATLRGKLTAKVKLLSTCTVRLGPVPRPVQIKGEWTYRVVGLGDVWAVSCTV